MEGAKGHTRTKTGEKEKWKGLHSVTAHVSGVAGASWGPKLRLREAGGKRGTQRLE